MRLFCIIILFFSINCKGDTQYADPNRSQGGPTWGPYEIKITVKKMTRSLRAFLDKRNKPVYIRVARIKNRTSEHINTRLLTGEMAAGLIKSGINFIDDSLSKEAIEEMSRKLKISKSIQNAYLNKKLPKPNLLLYGMINDEIKFKNGSRYQYIYIIFKLRDIKTKRQVWQKMVDFYKKTERPKISF